MAEPFEEDRDYRVPTANEVGTLDDTVSAHECDGYSTALPIDEHDLLSVFAELRSNSYARKFHNQDGFLCASAGCLDELGPRTDAADEWNLMTQPSGWDEGPGCVVTRHSDACTTCESADCEAFRENVSTERFWALFGPANATTVESTDLVGIRRVRSNPGSRAPRGA